MKTILLIVLAALLCGCDRKIIQSTSSGTETIVTNGAAWTHTWNYADSYYFISNTIPQ
jgi:hypothetical protein